jgi:glycosyltransferase involved in cell wall biosynthesis
VDLARFAPRPSQGVREQWGVPPGHLLVAAVGRLVEKKGFRYLVDAAARVGGIAVVLAGDGDLRADLEMRVRTSGGPVRLPGSLDRASVEALLGAADVAVVPSVVDQAGNVDGLPNSLLEALAAGKAVVASNVAGIPEVVDDGENGLLVPGGDVAALTEALERLVADAELRVRLGAQARQRAERQLGWTTIVERYEASLVRAQALAAR